MNSLRFRLLCIGSLMILGIACTNDKSSPRMGAGSTAPGPSDSASTFPVTLDLILGGPFAFVQIDNGLVVWVPNVKDHSKPLGVGLGDEIRSFEQADYDFTTGIRPSKGTNVLVPVKEAGVLTLSRQQFGLSATPKKKPFLTIKLPIPREIVPWNGDPITVSDSATGANSAETARLSTMTILRYDFQVGDSLEMKAKGQPSWKPHTIDVGTEHALLFAVIPPAAQSGQDEHKHARAAFLELTKLLGVKRSIDFPNVTYTRNQPLVPGVLSPDLLTILGVAARAPAGTEQAQFANLSTIFGKINDCKSPAALLAR